MRDEFERLINSEIPDADFTTTDEGEYLSAEIQGRWEGYQMRQHEVDRLIQEIFALREKIKRLEKGAT